MAVAFCARISWLNYRGKGCGWLRGATEKECNGEQEGREREAAVPAARKRGSGRERDEGRARRTEEGRDESGGENRRG